MDIIRRNTDYALRIVALLSGFYQNKKSVSARNLSKESAVPYPLTCKLLHKLQKKEIVSSVMGPKGGYRLAQDPDQINFLDVIETIQGPISVNSCLLGQYQCPRKEDCPLHDKLAVLQTEIVDSLKDRKISELATGNGKHAGE